MKEKAPTYLLRPCHLDVARKLCAKFHGYGSVGNNATYCFAVFETNKKGVEKPVAVYVWQPPPPGAAKTVCPEAPQGVLALSRMVAVPKEKRQLQHVSKPLRRMMRQLIDRTRWPVLITYSDESLGHTGHVYKCSGWQPTVKSTRNYFVDAEGRRQSRYSNGKYAGDRGLKLGGVTTLQRWEHWACARGKAARWMKKHGWRRVPIPGKIWRSGNPAFTYMRKAS